MKVIEYGQWVLAFVLPLVASSGNAATSLTDGRQAFGVPGFGNVSRPSFLDAGETLRVSKKGSKSNSYWQLTGTGSTTSFWGSLHNSVNLGKDSVKFQANFNSAGQLINSIGTTKLSNYLEIRGSLPKGKFGATSWTVQPNQLLLQATLLDENPANGASDLISVHAGSVLGFNTKFTGGWAAKNRGLTAGATGDSLWLAGVSSGFQNLVNALDGNARNGTLNSLIGTSRSIGGVTSVAGIGRSISSSSSIMGGSSVATVPVPGAVWLFGTGMMTLVASRRKIAGPSLAV